MMRCYRLSKTYAILVVLSDAPKDKADITIQLTDGKTPH